MKTIVIIGGGFCGTMTAVNLARFARRPARIVIVNHRRPLGRGTAYGTRHPEHLLNVAARNMSALADQPDNFIEWLRCRSEFGDVPEAELRETFVPRRIYGDPAIAVDRLRPHTQRIWKNFSLDEKREFLDRYSACWNATRHRIPRSIHDRVSQAIAEGRLRVVRGAIDAVERCGAGVRVLFHAEGGRRDSLAAALAINCTGPQTRFSATDVQLFQNLLRRGLVRPDPLDMGIDVDEDLAVIGRDGGASRCLFALGPLLKGTLWETTAVPELRGQAMQLARVLLADEAPEGDDRRFQMREEAVIEYYI